MSIMSLGGMSREILRMNGPSLKALRGLATQPEVTEKIGFIGFGEMGSRMVKNLVSNEGQEVVICDDRSEALKKAEELGVESTSSPASLASTEGVRIIISMLPTSKAVRDAFLGGKGIIQAAGSIHPSLLIDCSTVDPNISREIAQEMMNAGLHRESRPFPGCSSSHPTIIDAPVSGGINAAALGNLTFMVGGSQDGAKAAQPFLHMLGKNNFYCGSHGNGQLAKIANNVAVGIQMASIAEAMAFGMRNGLDPKILSSIINKSTGRCWSSQDYNPVPGIMEGVPANREYKGGFASSHMLKDLKIALSTDEHSSERNLPMCREATKLYEKIVEEDASLDFSAIFKYCYRS